MERRVFYFEVIGNVTELVGGNRMRRKIISIIVVVFMCMQALMVYAELPSELTSKKYVEIPVYYGTEQTSIISKELSKTVNGITLKGKAIFYIRAFAYETGDQIKIGSQVNFIGADGKLQQEWWDQNITTDKASVNWPTCDKAYVTVNDDMQFVSKDQNIDETRVVFSMTALGNTFSRATGNIKLDAGFGTLDVVLKAINADNTVLDIFKSSFVGEGNTSQKIFTDPIMVDPGAKVNVNIKGNYLKSQEYVVIKSDTAPTLPLNASTKWEDLGALEKVEPNMWESYPDLLKDKQGYLSTKHYNYKYGEKTTTSVIPPRAETFCYPIGENNVYQLATTGADNQYHSVEGEKAFFGESLTGTTTFTATFIPTQNISYQFSIYCNDYKDKKYVPTLKVTDNKTKNTTILVAGLGGGGSYYHGNQDDKNKGKPYVTTYSFKAGETYTFEGTWFQNTGNDPVPTLYYRTASSMDAQNGWTMIPSGFFNTEKYTGGANKAVKFWGYMVPTGDNFKDGKYNMGSFADDGIYGYIMIDNEKVTFAEDWTLSAPANRTGINKGGLSKDNEIVNVELKKDKVYPIYMEWYEGRPTQKSFIPRYKESGTNVWKDIPQDWFYASADSTPGLVNIAYFDSYVADSVINLPEDPGTYYVAVRVKTELGEDKQVLQGPFKIEKFVPTPPVLTEGTGNKIIPTSVSNISLNTNFTDYAKKIEYSIDISNLAAEKITVGGSTPHDVTLLNFDNTRISARIKSGGTVVDPSNYLLSLVKAAGKTEIKIKFKDDFEVVKGNTQEVQLYFTADCGSGVEADKYTDVFAKVNKAITLSAQVSVSPGYEKAVTNPDGSKTNEIKYDTPEIASNSPTINANYGYIPQIH